MELKKGRKYEQELARINHTRATLVLLLFYLFEWFIYFKRDLFPGIGGAVLVFLVFATGVLPVMITIYFRFDHTSKMLKKLMVFITVLSFYGLGMGLTMSIQATEGMIHVFLIVIIGVAAFFYMRPIYTLFALWLPAVVFVMVIKFAINNEMTDVYVYNTVMTSAIAFALSVNMYVIKNREFVNRDKMAEKNEMLKHLTRIDKMSSLFNHESILEILNAEIKASNRYNENLVIMLFDLDNFKNINDRYGHTEGDQVIKDVARCLKAAARSSDFIGRYGGEEFLVVAPRNTFEGAERIYEKFKSLIADESIGRDYAVTASCGVAAFNGQSLDDFIRQADNRLYAAKRQGKNRCVINEALSVFELL